VTALIVCTIICFVLLVAACVALIYVVPRHLRALEKLDEVQEQVEQSLKVLDKCYGNIGRSLTVPVASNDPIVRKVLGAIKEAHSAILLVANKIDSAVADDTTEETK
jgi:hypothetical protein